MSMVNIPVDSTAGGVLVLAKNGNRRMALIKAPKANTATVYLKLDASATALDASVGYPLEPGESVQIGTLAARGPVGASLGGDAEYWCEVRGFTSTPTQNLRVQEL